MKKKALVSEKGLTKDKEYEVIEQSGGYYKVINDNGDKVYREENLFENEMDGENTLIIDPENEHVELAQILGGELITIDTNNKTFINPFDIEG